MNAITESDLQRIVFELLREKKLAKVIRNLSFFKGRRKASKPGTRRYSYRNILADRYDSAVIWICERLANWNIQLIGDIRPTNISLEKSDRLYPDIVAHDDCRNFFVFELKVGPKTEREAVTELFAYVFELRTLMPNLNNNEISLIIISEEFGVLLSHAVLQILSFFGLKIMCLKPIFLADLKFEIVDPLNSLGIRDYRISEDSLTVYSLCLYQNKSISLQANNKIDHIIKITGNMLLDRANRLASNGFYLLHKNTDTKNEVGNVATYYLTIALLDPFKLMDINSLYTRKTNISSALLKLFEEQDAHLQNHFWELVSEAAPFLEKFYRIDYEAPSTYEQFSFAVQNWGNVTATSCNVWGEFGEFIREIIYASKTGEDFFNEELDHTNPYCLWDALEFIFEDTLPHNY